VLERELANLEEHVLCFAKKADCEFAGSMRRKN
jgi:hypothetical protein